MRQQCALGNKNAESLRKNDVRHDRGSSGGITGQLRQNTQLPRHVWREVVFPGKALRQTNFIFL
ncbi:hypothetical protein B4R02_13970 [Salmonella enterica]|nr:hypothetical protein [Salmonella enterica]EBE3720112.1 hypothetical protein [Salmonella enterica subsp. diarizonae serovar 42:l,v:1,5,7]EBX1218828.1 hypothetical protein [Salmonella enterica subsp. enterica serovar Newport]EBX4722633.1 hypothetical protein [Salmonella enterica subsp. enterica serovar Rubislaw]EBY0806523.1 hypothetical protein [Salmonella enterica subsp. enterica serovar Berlin]ECC9264382.1 hypothetical protein [Salmonella enterica subsp. diarizonae]ECG6794760.1 hypothetica